MDLRYERWGPRLLSVLLRKLLFIFDFGFAICDFALHIGAWPDVRLLVALPGEIFYEAGRHIAEQLDAEPICVAGYCHGYIGYVPVPEAYERGGYEVDEAHRFAGLWRVGPETTQLLQREVLTLWQSLGGPLK